MKVTDVKVRGTRFNMILRLLVLINLKLVIFRLVLTIIVGSLSMMDRALGAT